MTVSRIPELQSSDPRIVVGRFTYGAPAFRIWTAEERIEIGAFCSIADDVTIFGGGEHRSDWITTFPLRIAFGHALAERDGHPATRGPTRIGNDVWIGHGATIMSGVTIGDGAIIGARAVVSRDVDSYAVVVGNPARRVRSRFPADQVEALMRIQWWKWPIELIEEFVPLLCDTDISAFIRKARQDSRTRTFT
ncbi:CatB-related O-acetyltransferase [Pseudoxanthomonas winnipegensis]|uniref:CatB-related O-acetyltransferase n=1 Tax=Pseudoxanthomonas winnipegensis TaxID=2480810 RepID=UPI00102DA306|nr:CatB-related O-acetyltransferase [Pseudoxanthomonas winnipegensis]TAA44352.1 CatB-related O-acetyltransferase [Pseudoxanthomonas winnipegensis]